MMHECLWTAEISPRQMRAKVETISSIRNQQMHPKAGTQTYICITKMVTQRFKDVNPRDSIQRLFIERDIDIHSTSSSTRCPDVSRSQGLEYAVIVERRKPPGWELYIHL